MQRHRSASSLSALAALAVFGAAPARAASLQKVEQGTWGVGGLPGYVNMYVYVPDKLASKPPILVASHHCGGSASSTFNETRSTFVSLADKNGFVIVVPEATGHNCWDVGSSKSLKHDGGGDTHAVAQMVRYALSKYDGDPSRVYAFGTSSGAMMTEALLGVYPDMFMAGVSVAGVPCGCWAAQYTEDNQWSGPCAGGNVSKTAQEWGDQVRAMFPGYKGHRPRVQLWHGTADTTISFKNLGESVKEWTNVLSLSEMPSATDSAKSGYMHQTWKNDCGYVSLETWAQQGAGHNVTWDAASAVAFLGLDRVGARDPEAVACPATSGASGAGGMVSAAGSGGSSAAAGRAGSAGSSGAAANGGAAAAGRAGMPGSAAAGRGPAANAGAPGAAGAKPVSSAAGSAGGVATRADAQSAAGMAAATSSAGASDPSPAVADSSGGCSVGIRGAPPGAHFTLVPVVLWLLVRRRSRTCARTSPAQG
ncbi:MAG TPA: PHB depolymerase family esterase [Polyangiales bacterium]|nr:PHB depolymerase family esterase [Polyangiales bacterium]